MRGKKYGNQKTVVGGIAFASKREAARYTELTLLQRAGKIRDLELQVSFPMVINGWLICRYVADFVYEDIERGGRVVEDAKGFRTREYRLKRKLMRALYGVEVREV